MSRCVLISCAAWVFAFHVAFPPSTAAQEVPFTSVVVDQAVPVRAGAGRSFYTVGELKQGTPVTVDEVVFGWYKIRPPKGIHSYISRAFVDAYGDGKTGKINTNRAAVRAASINGPGESYRRQIDLLKGATVQIVGEEGSFYKIVPPNRAYVFLPPGALQPSPGEAGSDQAANALHARSRVTVAPPTRSEDRYSEGIAGNGLSASSAPTQATSKKPVEVESKPSSSPHAKADKPEQDAVSNTIDLASPGLKAAEARLMESLSLPLEQQPIQELIDIYQSLSWEPGNTLVDGRIIAMRIGQLKRNEALLESLREIAEAKKESENQPLSQFVDQLPPPLLEPYYDVKGRLQISAVYDGKNMPRLYRVTTANNRIITYARLHPTLDPAPYLDEYVGVLGMVKYDPTLKLEIIEVEHLDRIDSSASKE